MGRAYRVQLPLLEAVHVRGGGAVRVRGHPGRLLLALRRPRVDLRLPLHDSHYAHHVRTPLLRPDHAIISHKKQN
jgi:hypothetical protein